MLQECTAFDDKSSNIEVIMRCACCRKLNTDPTALFIRLGSEALGIFICAICVGKCLQIIIDEKVQYPTSYAEIERIFFRNPPTDDPPRAA